MKILDRVFCIYYLVQFWKHKDKDVLALLNFGNKVNAMTPDYIAQLGVKLQKTDISAQKIDRSSLAIYNMVIVVF